MKKVGILAVMMTLLFAGCTKDSPPNPLPNTMSNSDVKLSIIADKPEYKRKEGITCYAIIEYVGKEESITIEGGVPLVMFAIEGGAFSGSYGGRDLVARSYTLMKNVPEEFQFYYDSVTSDDTPEFILSPGEYALKAYMDFRFENDTEHTIELEVATTIKVNEG